MSASEDSTGQKSIEHDSQPRAYKPATPHRIVVQEFVSVALMLLLGSVLLFAWIDWRRRIRNLPKLKGMSWSCPNCNIVNEAEGTICWSCGAGVPTYLLTWGQSMAKGSWKCPTCRAWNGANRRSCWSCSTSTAVGPRRYA